MGRLGPPFFSCLGGIISSFTEQGLYDFDVERESDGIFRLNGPAASEGCSARDARRFSPEFHRVLLFLRHELRQLFALPRARGARGRGPCGAGGAETDEQAADGAQRFTSLMIGPVLMGPAFCITLCPCALGYGISFLARAGKSCGGD